MGFFAAAARFVSQSVVRGAPEAAPLVRMSDGSVFAPSSFGMANTSVGPRFSARAIWGSRRRRVLGHLRRYYDCTQHDGKEFDSSGRKIPAGPPIGAPLIRTEVPWLVPFEDRRPAFPARLAKTIVRAFTAQIFGDETFPAISVAGDAQSEDFLRAFVEETGLDALCVRWRNLGGAVGTTALSWRVSGGVPEVTVHSGENLWVHAWKSRARLVPEHVTELWQEEVEEIDPESQEVVQVLYWRRRDWTPVADIEFVPVRVDPSKKTEPAWRVDADRTVRHGDGFPHIVWCPNVPSDDHSEIDGAPDYADSYEALDSHDVTNSVAHLGTVRNLDPTLHLNVDPAKYQAAQEVRKGSDFALAFEGDAKYLELSGSSQAAGEIVIKRERAQILEASECVIPDPDVVAAAGTSSLGLKLVYRPMIQAVKVRRTQYAGALVLLLEQVLESMRRLLGTEPGTVHVEVGEDGAQEEVSYEIRLPPRIEEVLDDDGSPTGKVVETPRVPGRGGKIQLTWPPDFSPTPDDVSKQLSALQTACSPVGGALPIVSHRRAVELAAQLTGSDPEEEWDACRAAAEAAAKAASEAQAGMFPPTGDVGGDGADAGLDEGAGAPP